jgi:hypothetical protein
MNINLLNAVNTAEMERSALEKLNVLMDEWKSYVSKYTVWDSESQRKYPADECFCSDGFFPCYYRQKPKILFIAREAVGMWGEDYITTLVKAFRENLVAGVPVNRHAFFSRMMYIAYGAIKGNCEKPYDSLPWAGDIA